MYFADITNFLDENGAVAPLNGAGQQLADFLGNVIATATAPGAACAAPSCFKCHGATMVSPPLAGVIEWSCTGCGETGQIKNWAGTPWDLTPRDGSLSRVH